MAKKSWRGRRMVHTDQNCCNVQKSEALKNEQVGKTSNPITNILNLPSLTIHLE